MEWAIKSSYPHLYPKRVQSRVGASACLLINKTRSETLLRWEIQHCHRLPQVAESKSGTAIVLASQADRVMQ